MTRFRLTTVLSAIGLFATVWNQVHAQLPVAESPASNLLPGGTIVGTTKPPQANRAIPSTQVIRSGFAEGPAVVIPSSPVAPPPMPPDPQLGTGKTPGEVLPSPAEQVITGQKAEEPKEDPNNPIMHVKWNNGLNFVTSDKDWIIHLGGRLQFQPVFWSQPLNMKGPAPGSGGLPALKDGDGVGALDDGAFFRRVRLRSDGTAYGTVEYMFEVDFEQLNFVTFDHMWAGFKDVPFLGTIRIGQHKIPQGLEMISSDYHLTFLEDRSSLGDAFWTLFAPGIFIANDFFDKNVTFQAMLHRIQPLGFYTGDFGDGDYACTSRLTYTPVYQEEGEYVVHLGGSYQWRHADLGRSIQPGSTGNVRGDAQDAVRFRARPELRDATGIGTVGNGVLGGDVGRFVDTGFLAATSVSTAAAEFLAILGPLSVQAEATAASVANARSLYPAEDFGKSRGTPVFWGAYAQASYFLTGEHRGYDRRFGNPDRPKVKNKFNPKKLNPDAPCEDCDGEKGWGWEFAYRYSYVDLNDNDINGGLLSQHSLGLNWYINDNFKIQFIYLNAHRGVTAPAVSGTVHGLGMLTQWYF